MFHFFLISSSFFFFLRCCLTCLFCCKAPMGDLLSEMSPDTAPAVYPVWRYSCSSIMYAPWFLLMVAGSK